MKIAPRLKIGAIEIKPTEGARNNVCYRFGLATISKAYLVTRHPMSLWKLYYHVVWSTHERLPLITPKREAALYQYCNDKADALGAQLHAIGGIDNHVHLVVSIPPKIAIAEFVRRIKGSSSHYLNSRHPDDDCGKFKWQQNYGVFSLGRKQLDFAIAYVQNQKHHHLNYSTLPTVEPEALLESSA